MYFYPKLDEKQYPDSSKLISKIYNNKKFFKSDYQDLKISKEIINYYHQLKKSYMIGDRLMDILCGNEAGCKIIFINRNYKEKKPLSQIVSVKNLKEVTKCIIKNLKKWQI